MTRKQRIESIIMQNLSPTLLEIIDESFQHNVPKNAETHFNLLIIDNKFQGLTKINRHRLVNKLLSNELQQGLHALSMHLYAPSEWESRKNAVPPSPSCLDGYHND